MNILWQAQEGPQAALMECPVFEIFYGGARGGGKTDGVLGKWLQHTDRWGADANGIIVRRKLTQLEEMIKRAKQLYKPLGADWKEQKSTFTFPNGSELKFRYLERDSDAEEYQGHAYTYLGCEELTNFSSPTPIDKMRATLRSAKGVVCQMISTGNPGGVGHTWVKKRYIDPAPKGFKVLKERFVNPWTNEEILMERVFIPSKLTDNPLLLYNDPMYVARLQQQGSKALVKAWLEGLWDIAEGAFFDNFNPQIHVVPIDLKFRVPPDAVRFRAFDWGSAKPFSCGWYAVSDGTWGLPPKALLKYREWYGMKEDQYNVGLKLTAEQVAVEIARKELAAQETITYGVADPAIMVRDGGPSISERMWLSARIGWKAGDRKRKVGWDQLRQYLDGELGEDLKPTGVPLLYFTEDCEHTIRTLPAVPHDETDPEDVDTDSEDHAADETRYATMSRPFLRRKQDNPANVLQFPKAPNEYTIRELMRVNSARRRALRGEDKF